MLADRRRFLQTGTATFAAAALAARGGAQEKLPPVRNPRATDGDARHEPKWDEQLTITVGNSQADLVGQDDRVLEFGIDTK